jgi:hypothetical protein
MPAMCGDKVGFERRTEAEARAGRISGKTDLEMRVYRCPFCELFHLTTQAET